MTISKYLKGKKSEVQMLLSAGIAASILVGIAEWLLHFLEGGPGGEIAMLDQVPLTRASKGHFIALYAAPLYFLGYYGVMRIFEGVSYWLSRALLILGIYAFAIGSVWISSRYFGAEVFQTSAGTPDYQNYVSSYNYHYQSIVWSLRICVILISVIYMWLILKNKIGLPKWMMLINPAFLLGIVISTLIWAKPIGVHLAPIAMNAAHFVFFLVLLIQFRKLSIQKV